MTREEAIARIREHKIVHKMNEPRAIYISEALDMAIEALEQEQRWIPVSERLPEEGTYLVTVERIDGEPRIDMKSFAKDLHKVDEFDFPKHKCGWYDYDSEYGYWEDTKVIAWMPLPEPYKAESEETETWNGIHAQITAPNGTFERIFNDADDI